MSARTAAALRGATRLLTRAPWGALSCALALVGCASALPRPTPQASLRAVVVPSHARVYVDEHFVGAARVLDAQPVPLAGGKRRVTIEAPGYFPHDLEVTLVPGVTRVDVQLRPVPP